VRESRPPGSVRGVRSNAHPYRDTIAEGVQEFFKTSEVTESEQFRWCYMRK